MADTTETLANCPFCGNAAIQERIQWLQCSICLATAPSDAWNRRTSDGWRTARAEEGGILPPSSSEAHEPTGWRPIDSAPKDGSDIILCLDPKRYGRPAWIDHWDDANDCWFRCRYSKPMIVGWMPLPAPPVDGRMSFDPAFRAS